MAFVTLKDVAQRAGVSAAAVSQILHNKGRFSSDTRQLVLNTVEEMGYVPDQRARSMRSSDTKTVGLLVPDLRNPYFADLVSSMEDELYARGYSTLIGTSAETVERRMRLLTICSGSVLMVRSWCRKVSIRLVCSRLSRASYHWCSWIVWYRE